MSYPKYCFLTNLSCKSVADIVSKQSVPWLTGGGISGKSYGNKIEIYHHTYGNRSLLKYVFYGTVSEHLNGTMIAGHFQETKYLRALLPISQGFIVLMFIVILVQNIYTGASIVVIMISSISILSILLSTFIISKMWEAGSEEDKKEVIKFIKKELLATPYKGD